MVEFRFDIKSLFPEPVVKVASNLLPHTFRGDRRQCLDATSKMSEIIDRVGELSAAAQKLTKPVTTAQRLRMSENQIIYIMADVNEGHHGAVIGLLKVGTKDLYLFDENGQTRKIDQTPCILDFYIHESRQRAGLGKQLFETMLLDQQWTALQCSVDRPSEKLIAFLRKYYGLVKMIPQANNFVLYEGFFNGVGGDGDGCLLSGQHQQQTHANGTSMNITNSPNTQLFGAHYGENDHYRKCKTRQQQLDAAENLAKQLPQNGPNGRYGARRPICSMAEKTGSEVSLTPSQAADVLKQNPRKNPLDALSRMSVRYETVEKRSGLQDVNDEYLKKNLFSKTSMPKHSGLNEQYGMSQQQMQQVQHQNAAGIGGQILQQTESTYQLPPGSDGAAVTASQAQMQAQAAPPQTQAAGQVSQQQQQQPPLPLAGKNQASNIIHNASASARKGNATSESNSTDGDDGVDSITAELQQQQLRSHHHHDEKLELETHLTLTNTDDAEISRMPSEAADMEQQGQELSVEISVNDRRHSKTPTLLGSETITIKKPSSFKLSKQHTGMKNISFGVGMAVTPSGKMEFVQEAPEDFGVVKINRPVAKLNSPPPPPAAHDDVDGQSTVSSEGLTDQGYHDLKFYHNRLW